VAELMNDVVDLQIEDIEHRPGVTACGIDYYFFVLPFFAYPFFFSPFFCLKGQ
jgi:hypothetical protein